MIPLLLVLFVAAPILIRQYLLMPRWTPPVKRLSRDLSPRVAVVRRLDELAWPK